MREKEKNHQAKRSSLSVKNPVMNYSTWPIYECWMSAGLWDAGIGHVVISRKNNTFNVAVGVYLILADPKRKYLSCYIEVTSMQQDRFISL